MAGARQPFLEVKSSKYLSALEIGRSEIHAVIVVICGSRRLKTAYEDMT